MRISYPEATLAEGRCNTVITVWDGHDSPPSNAGLVYCWNGYAEKEGVYSLLRYAETHGERLRRKYVAWIHQLGESRVDDKRLIDHLVVEAGLSFWWMTLLVEKSYWKSPFIGDAIRLFALEEIVVECKPAALHLSSARGALAEALGGLCERMGVPFELQRLPAKRVRLPAATAIFRALPQGLRALVSLAQYLRSRWPLKQKVPLRWFGGDRSLLLCSYFLHLDQKASASGIFRSGYWGDLPAALHASGHPTNWLQHYMPSASAPNTPAAKDLVRRFNELVPGQDFHAFLDAYLSWPMVFRALRRWVALNVVYWRLRGVRHAFEPRGGHFSLWPLLRDDWCASLCGPPAIENLLWLELFDRALRDMPRQSKGLYLCENQGWERALIHVWRKHGHGQLIAVAHATVRFWDLRYFIDQRTLRSTDPCPLPQPDLIAVNSRVTVDDFLRAGYSRDALVECETLRYGGLNTVQNRRSLRDPAELQVLILGDYLPAITTRMLTLLEEALPLISLRVVYTIKPHPGCPIRAEDYPDLHLRIVAEPLERILQDFDVAYSSSVTSAAVDAYVAGLPVIVMLDVTELIYSPLRGQSGARFVGTAEELAGLLREISVGTPREQGASEIFFVDPQLPRWKRLLAMAA